ncbi:MAG: hypothetical protein FJ197_00205 [Gammaproteobacteria bacterium]|nr:hypothetical protein [Gammaproteobacteria bacterium]
MGLQDSIRTKSFTLTAEMTPVPDAAAMISQARGLLASVDAVQVTDHPTGQPRVPSLTAAAVLRHAGIDPVLHLNCRDKSRATLQGELLGAATLGVSSLFLMRNGPFNADPGSDVEPAAEVSATDLIAAARELRDTESPERLGLAAAPDFFIGAVATVFDAPAGWEPRALRAKVDAGARFLQTQLCLDVDLLRRYLRRFPPTQLPRQCHVMASLAVPASADGAIWLKQRLRGALVPDGLVARLRQARDPAAESVAACAELLQEMTAIPGLAGARFIAPTDPALLSAVVAASGLRGGA